MGPMLAMAIFFISSSNLFSGRSALKFFTVEELVKVIMSIFLSVSSVSNSSTFAEAASVLYAIISSTRAPIFASSIGSTGLASLALGSSIVFCFMERAENAFTIDSAL